MRVGLDGRGLAAPVRSGVERYVVELARALAALEERPEIVAYLDRPVADWELGRVLSGGMRTRVLRAPRGWLRVALPWRLWRDRMDLVHLPSTILPPLLPCPAVVTVHDLAWAHYPETYDPADLEMQTQVVPRSVRRAAHVIAVSESTAHDLAAILGVPGEKITVTPLGVSPGFRAEGPRLPRDAFPGAERLSGGYVLYAGALAPRKNLGRVLEAYLKVVSEGVECPLVLAGARSAHAEELARMAKGLGIEEKVLFAGHVRERLLPALFRGAAAFVYASLYEGFGMPVLEAMASGVPVVTSNGSGTAEVAGKAALRVDPESVEEIARALSRVLKDEALREKLAAQGLIRSRGYRWELTARQTASVYRRVGGEG
ncbi:MAG: glycosyltransferase family 4 protein [Armatimonadota bacterium]|nr:MAG: glycosyltransferase family 4 protein [Armatimonadota bacterium]